jgi:uncharacterized membrane protein YgcG
VDRVGLATIILFIGCMLTGYILAAVIVFVAGFFVISVLIKLIMGVRCEHDGLKMKRMKKEGNHIYYKCPKGHVGWILAGAGVGSAAYFGGGFRGGGGFGGGGFGGGGSGGGGAGR